MICELKIHGRAPSGLIASALWAGGIPLDESMRSTIEPWGGDLERAWREATFELLLPVAVIRHRGINAVAKTAALWVELAARELGVSDRQIRAACALAVDPEPSIEQCTATKQALLDKDRPAHYHLRSAASFVAGLAAQRLSGHAPLAKHEGYFVGVHLQQLFSSTSDLFAAQSTFLADATAIARADLS